MRIALIIYAAFSIFWITVIITQVVMPAIRGTALFPNLRGSRREVEANLTEEMEKHDQKIIRERTQQIKKS